MNKTQVGLAKPVPARFFALPYFTQGDSFLSSSSRLPWLLRFAEQNESMFTVSKIQITPSLPIFIKIWPFSCTGSSSIIRTELYRFLNTKLKCGQKFSTQPKGNAYFFRIYCSLRSRTRSWVGAHELQVQSSGFEGVQVPVLPVSHVVDVSRREGGTVGQKDHNIVLQEEPPRNNKRLAN